MGSSHNPRPASEPATLATVRRKTGRLKATARRQGKGASKIPNQDVQLAARTLACGEPIVDMKPQIWPNLA